MTHTFTFLRKPECRLYLNQAQPNSDIYGVMQALGRELGYNGELHGLIPDKVKNVMVDYLIHHWKWEGWHNGDEKRLKGELEVRAHKLSEGNHSTPAECWTRAQQEFACEIANLSRRMPLAS